MHTEDIIARAILNYYSSCYNLLVMAKRRTKKDKIIAQLRREVQTSSLDSESVYSYDKSFSKKKTSKSQKISENKTTRLSKLFSYNPDLIRKDLVRTVFLSILALAIELGLFFYLRN